MKLNRKEIYRMEHSIIRKKISFNNIKFCQWKIKYILWKYNIKKDLKPSEKDDDWGRKKNRKTAYIKDRI